MKINISPLEKAFEQLQTSQRYLHSALAKQDNNLRLQFRNSVIQCFEFTYELAYKMILRQLTQIVETSENLKQMNFSDLIRTAAQAGLIPDVKRFLQYREMRNLTSHTYDDRKAELVLTVLDDFEKDIDYLIQQLNSRNT